MAQSVKTDEEIELMRIAGHKLARVHEALREFIRPGITTKSIDELGERLILEEGGIPNFKNYGGYPASICVSVNDEIVHGIPSDERILKEGDIVSLDAGLIWKGYHSDAARTWGVGNISAEAEKLIEVTRESFFEGMKYARAGCHLYDISRAVEAYAESFGFGVVRELTGHGIGNHLHEPPLVPNTAQKGRGLLLVPNMTIAVEPMINAGAAGVLQSDDGWTVYTSDGSLSAHYENTVLIRDGEPELLTCF
ncbi:MAG: type I methionyl aminopeptidase [Lachnospiraceae bacterium]|nr:type I methionyl aminopeptidase [Lachnospiraceae bacterium]